MLGRHIPSSQAEVEPSYCRTVRPQSLLVADAVVDQAAAQVQASPCRAHGGVQTHCPHFVALQSQPEVTALPRIDSVGVGHPRGSTVSVFHAPRSLISLPEELGTSMDTMTCS